MKTPRVKFKECAGGTIELVRKKTKSKGGSRMNSKEKNLRWGGNLWSFADGMLGPLFAVFAGRIGGTILDISSAWAIYLIFTGIFVIIFGKLSDRYSKEKMMITGYGLTALFTFGYLWVSTPWRLFLVQAGLGLALALANPTWYALYDRYSSSPRDGYLWGLADGQSKILTGMAIIIGGFVVETFSFELLFILMGSLQVVATLYQAQILRK